MSMGYRREPFQIGEWYHCYNRGIDKRVVFDSESDSERFLQSLYLCNDEKRAGRSDFDYYPHPRIFTIQRFAPLVSIGAYSLMPNHFHLLMQEKVENGISKFMHKLGTSYTMYFNEKNGRVGNLFYKPFRSRRVSNDSHFSYLPQYLHLNPIEMFEHGWKKGVLRRSLRELQRELSAYRFSSYMDYSGHRRPENSILDPNAASLLMGLSTNPLTILSEANEYYSQLKLS